MHSREVPVPVEVPRTSQDQGESPSPASVAEEDAPFVGFDVSSESGSEPESESDSDEGEDQRPSSLALERGDEVADDADEVSDESSSSSSEEDGAPQPVLRRSARERRPAPHFSRTMRGDHHVTRRASAQVRPPSPRRPPVVVTPRSVSGGGR